MINNRQAGRRRGRGGNNPGGGGGGNGGGGGQRQGRGDNGNRIDSRARGNAAQLYEKYKNMASDAQRQGDRVNTEYYLQFADHYFRVISDQRGRFDEQPRRDRDDFDGDGTDDFGDEGDPIRAGEQQMDPRGDREPRDRDVRSDRDRLDRDRPDRDRDDRDRSEPRADRDGRSEREPRDGRDQRPEPRADRQDRAPREGNRDGNREAGRDQRPDRDTRRPRQPAEMAEVEVGGQHRADPIEAGESLHARAEAILEADAPLAPRRRGRPRRDAAEVQGRDAAEQQVELQADQAVDAPSLDADRLPPSLLTPANDADGDVKPRRRRLRSPAAEAPDAAE